MGDMGVGGGGPREPEGPEDEGGEWPLAEVVRRSTAEKDGLSATVDLKSL